ncbi:MAG TPA: TonB family protein [Longimicrobiales bacterium]|nr:TonB family protein [Longimicrobiales bacterium]
MTDRTDFLPDDLPRELAELDAELLSIGHEERPSFAPELEAELAREWSALQGRRYWPVRELMAAAAAGLLLAGLGVPSARAALVRFVGSLGTWAGEAPEAQAPAPVSGPSVTFPAERGTEAGLLSAPQPPEVPVPGAPGANAYTAVEATFPELLDRSRAEALVRRNYPISFQRAGIGGAVGVLLWVDSTGAVGFVNLGKSSGVPDLDRAALQVAPMLRFEPARRLGRAVGTWVEFDVRFEPRRDSGGEDWIPDAADAAPLPVTGPLTPELLGAADFLASAIADDRVVARLGSVERILLGEPPAGRAPTEWRSEVVPVLQAAMARAPENPAPFLALSRIRQRQGLRTEAHALLERGLEAARRSGGAVSPRILADLHFERGSLVKESWLGYRNLGRVRSDALRPSACSQAPSQGADAPVYAPVAHLIAWNYLCPEELGEILGRSFQSLEQEGSADRAVTMTSFRSAVEADPTHPGASMEVLLALADEERWEDLLASARRFVAVADGDPHGLLLEGLALQRLSRSEEAAASFAAALQALPADEAAHVEDVAPLLLEPQATEYAALAADRRADWREAFWRPLDPILATSVNERFVEHLARASYALMRFGSTLSDAGEVWVRYGQPDEVRAFEEGPGVRVELWDFGPGPDLTFRRLSTSEVPALTPEGRAYLEEVRQLVPHRYGDGSRIVFSLGAQVARFLEAGSTALEVEMHARVPVLFAGSPTDSLDVALVLLGESGSTLSVTRARVPAVEGDVALRATAHAAVAGEVVELYSAVTGQAAALRRSVAPLATASGATMSDVVLTAAASPRKDEVGRGRDWLEPLALDLPVQSHAIGAYVELYGVARVSPRYRLRAELRDRATGDLRDLPIQPAGESGFRSTWERLAGGRAVIAEFISVWLADVPPGRYVLRVIADVPDAGAPLAAEQALDRR